MIYFLLPVFNEEANIASVITGLRAGQFNDQIRIVAVNDGSTDLTAAVLNDLSGPDLIVLGTRVNMNIGAVFAAGIIFVEAQAQAGDLLVILESDQTSAVDLIPVMLDEIRHKGKDIVIASRYAPGGGYKNFPVPRLFVDQCRLCDPLFDDHALENRRGIDCARGLGKERTRGRKITPRKAHSCPPEFCASCKSLLALCTRGVTRQRANLIPP